MGDQYHALVGDSIRHHGNWGRLKKAMRRAAAGEDVTIAYLGGSITQGSLASVPQNCYAYRSFTWWTEHFSEKNCHYVNAGIGGTTSHFGAARVQEDVLRYRPAVVFVEFSVNDDDESHFRDTYEGLLRHLLTDECAPAVVLLHNAFYNDGHSAEEIHCEVGRHYDLPSVSFKRSVYQAVCNGQIPVRDITPDDLHPNDEGHRLLADTVRYFLDQVYAELEVDDSSDTEAAFVSPLTANRYERAKRLQNPNLSPLRVDGFEADETRQTDITDVFKKGWTATKKGSEITFEVNASCIAVQYRKTVKHPAPKAIVFLDERVESAIELDADFDQDWGDCLYLQRVIEGSVCTPHEVTIRIVEDSPEDQLPFYLVSLLIA